MAVKPIPKVGNKVRTFDWTAGASPAKASEMEIARDLAALDVRPSGSACADNRLVTSNLCSSHSSSKHHSCLVMPRLPCTPLLFTRTHRSVMLLPLFRVQSMEHRSIEPPQRIRRQAHTPTILYQPYIIHLALFRFVTPIPVHLNYSQLDRVGRQRRLGLKEGRFLRPLISLILVVKKRLRPYLCLG